MGKLLSFTPAVEIRRGRRTMVAGITMDTTADDSLTLPRFQALLPSSGSRGPWAALLRRIRQFGVEHLSDAAPQSRLVGSADGDHPRQVVHGVGALAGGEVVDGGAQVVGGPYAVGAHAAHNTRSDANGRTAGVQQVNGLPDMIPLREAVPRDFVEQESVLDLGSYSGHRRAHIERLANE